VDDGVDWKDEYAMGWYVVLAKGCTIVRLTAHGMAERA
jgi:hypothetical protein